MCLIEKTELYMLTEREWNSLCKRCRRKCDVTLDIKIPLCINAAEEVLHKPWVAQNFPQVLRVS